MDAVFAVATTNAPVAPTNVPFVRIVVWDRGGQLMHRPFPHLLLLAPSFVSISLLVLRRINDDSTQRLDTRVRVVTANPTSGDNPSLQNPRSC